MTDEQVNAALARWAGWEYGPPPAGDYHPSVKFWHKQGRSYSAFPPPYTSDRNALAELEARVMQDRGLADGYGAWLSRLVMDNPTHTTRNYLTYDPDELARVATAPPTIRCRALVAALGLGTP